MHPLCHRVLTLSRKVNECKPLPRTTLLSSLFISCTSSTPGLVHFSAQLERFCMKQGVRVGAV